MGVGVLLYCEAHAVQQMEVGLNKQLSIIPCGDLWPFVNEFFFLLCAALCLTIHGLKHCYISKDKTQFTQLKYIQLLDQIVGNGMQILKL